MSSSHQEQSNFIKEIVAAPRKKLVVKSNGYAFLSDIIEILRKEHFYFEEIMTEEYYHSLLPNKKEENQFFFLDEESTSCQIILFHFPFPEFNIYLKLLADRKMSDPWSQSS